MPTCAVWPGKIKAGTPAAILWALPWISTRPPAQPPELGCPTMFEGKSILPTMLGETQNFDRDLVFVRRERRPALQRAGLPCLPPGRLETRSQLPLRAVRTV